MNVTEDVRAVWKNLLPTETTTPEETITLGRCLAAALGSGHVVALHGELGAGKTHLIKGICAALGVDEREVTSPTFTVVHEYEGRDAAIFHLDAYRVERLEEWYELGVEQYLFGEGLCLIEWPERLEPLLPDDTLHLRLLHQNGDRRRIELVRSGRERERENRENADDGRP